MIYKIRYKVKPIAHLNLPKGYVLPAKSSEFDLWIDEYTFLTNESLIKTVDIKDWKQTKASEEETKLFYLFDKLNNL